MFGALALLLASQTPAERAPQLKLFTQQQFEARSPRDRIAFMLERASLPGLWKGSPLEPDDIAYAIGVPGNDSWAWRVELRGRAKIVGSHDVCERVVTTLEPYPMQKADQAAPGPFTTPLAIYRTWQERTFAPAMSSSRCPDEATGRYVVAPDAETAVQAFAAVSKMSALLPNGLPLEFGCTEPHGWERCRDAPARLHELLTRYSRMDAAPDLATHRGWRRFVIAADDGWSAIISVHEEHAAGAALHWTLPPVV